MMMGYISSIAGLSGGPFAMGHAFLCLGYFLLMLILPYPLGAGSWRRGLVETCLVVVLPVAGIIMLGLYHIVVTLLHLTKGHPPEQPDYGMGFSVGRQLPENVIPLNDAYLVDSQQQKRFFFTNAIKQAVVDNNNILKMAVHDKDREIAYYAVSMLTTKMEILEARIFAQEEMLRQFDARADAADAQPAYVDALAGYERLLHEYLSEKEFVDHVSWRLKQADYIKLLERLIKIRPHETDYYVRLVQQLLDTERYPEAESVCQSMLTIFPHDEISYLTTIALYQAWHQPGKMQAVLQQLRRAPIMLSNEALRVIRFWSQKPAGRNADE